MARSRGKENLIVDIDPDKVVHVEGEPVGRLDGLCFVADTDGPGETGRLIAAAAKRALVGEIRRRVEARELSLVGHLAETGERTQEQRVRTDVVLGLYDAQNGLLLTRTRDREVAETLDRILACVLLERQGDHVGVETREGGRIAYDEDVARGIERLGAIDGADCKLRQHEAAFGPELHGDRGVGCDELRGDQLRVLELIDALLQLLLESERARVAVHLPQARDECAHRHRSCLSLMVLIPTPPVDRASGGPYPNRRLARCQGGPRSTGAGGTAAGDDPAPGQR